MSKKQINNRLDQLFDDIKEEEKKTTKDVPAGKRKPKKKPKKSPQEQSNASLAVTAPLKAQESLVGATSTMSLPVRFDDDSWMSLAFYDQDGRQWHEEEKILAEQVVDQLTLALENARLFQETQLRAEELAVLNDLARTLSAQLNVEQVLEETYKGVRQLIDAKNFFIGLYKPESHEIEYPLNITESAVDKEITVVPADQGISGYILRTKQPLLIKSDLGKWLESQNMAAVGELAASWLGVPLMIGDNFLGLMAVQDYEKTNAYNENARDILSTFASQAAIAIESARSYERIQQAADEMSMLFDASQSFSSELLEVEEIAEVVARLFIKAFDLPSCVVSLYDPKENSVKTTVDLLVDEKKNELVVDKDGIGKVFPVDRFPALVRVIEKKQPLTQYINAPEVDPAELAYLQENKIASAITLPMVVKGTTIGIIELKSPDQEINISQDEINLAMTLANQAAAAIENARLFQEAQKRTEELSLLNKIVTEVSSALNLKESLETVAHEIHNIANALHVGVALLDDEKKNLVLSADYPGKDEDLGLTIPLQENDTSSEVLETQKPIVIQDIEHNPRMAAIREVMLQRGTHSLVIFPVLSGKDSIGTVGVDFSEPFAELSSEQINLIQTILLQAGTAIETARLFDQTKEAERTLKRQNDYMTAAAEVGRLVTETLDMDILFRRAVNLLCEHFGYYHASIFINEEAGLNTVVRESTGEAGREMKEREHALEVGSQSVVGNATGKGIAFVVNDVRDNPDHRPNPLLPETRAEAAIPLKIGRRIIGAIDLQSTEVGAFNEEDVAVLQILADQFATAIDNARSYKLAQDAFTEMRELDKLKSQFLANMSHELRTPLNSIIGFSRVILKGIDGPVTDLQQQDLTAIYNSGQHLLGLINDILDLSKIEAGKMELTFDEVDITKLIKSVMSTVIGLIKDKPVRLVEDIAEDLPIVRADSMRVRQILINLFSNASKFTEEGTITVKAERDGNFVRIGITDSGPGISEEDQEKLFKAFSQVDASATRATGGTGLGLSICRELVNMHEGIIDVESEVGKGSTFFFTLPFFHPEVEEEADETESGEQESDAPVILSIDDDDQVIQLYERYLTSQGYQLAALTEPKKAVERAKEIKPHAITLDIMMPGYNGWQVLQDLKSDPETQKIPIIICSIVEDTAKGYALGATDYLLKPIIEDDLISALNRLDAGGMIREVLVIDDDEDDLRLIEKFLGETQKYEPVLAQGGLDGWKRMESAPPHAVILDLFMPEMDGFEIIEKMQAVPELVDVPIIIVSGGDLTSTQQEKLNELNHHLLQKGTLDADGLIKALEHTLNQITPNTPKGTP